MIIQDDYKERVYAGVLGKIIGVYIGRPFEGWSYENIMERLGEVNYYVNKQLNKLVDVIKILDLTREQVVERELMLIQVSATSKTRSEIMEIVNVFRAKVVDISHNVLTVEISGSSPKVDGLLELLRPFGIKEMVRTGKAVMKRAAKTK